MRSWMLFVLAWWSSLQGYHSLLCRRSRQRKVHVMFITIPRTATTVVCLVRSYRVYCSCSWRLNLESRPNIVLKALRQMTILVPCGFWLRRTLTPVKVSLWDRDTRRSSWTNHMWSFVEWLGVDNRYSLISNTIISDNLGWPEVDWIWADSLNYLSFT